MKVISQISGEGCVTPLAEGLLKVIPHLAASSLRLLPWRAPRACYAILMTISRWSHCRSQISCFELCFCQVSIQLRYSVPQELIPDVAYRFCCKCTVFSLGMQNRCLFFFLSFSFFFFSFLFFLCPQPTQNLVIFLTVKESWQVNHNGLPFFSECSMDLIRLWVCP